MSDFLYKSICCGYSFELHQQVDASQIGTHNIYVCLYKKEDKKFAGCNLKAMELLNCVQNIGLCAIIRSYTVYFLFLFIGCGYLLEAPR